MLRRLPRLLFWAHSSSSQTPVHAPWSLLLLLGWALGLSPVLLLLPPGASAESKPFHRAELIFPLEHWHNHSPSIVETPQGDLIVCWFHGSGERQADDVIIEGARKRRYSRQWSPRFLMADTPDYPDTNCALFVDPRGKLWLFYPTILANEWHTALMKYRVSSSYRKEGPPEWEISEVLHVTPGDDFVTHTIQFARNLPSQFSEASQSWPKSDKLEWDRLLNYYETNATSKLSRRLGWMTRNHPIMLPGNKMLLPLYSDGFSFSLMAITEDWGKTWKTSLPICGLGNIQPSVVEASDGSLYTVMRDNGPPPKRLMQSRSTDGGLSWSEVTDSPIPNSGSSAEIIRLKNGRWAFIGNDTEKGRGRLILMLSDDDGKTWRWKRYLEGNAHQDGEEMGSFHYPSLIQARDGSLHAAYSYHLSPKTLKAEGNEKVPRKSIKHAHFNEAWVMQGDQ